MHRSDETAPGGPLPFFESLRSMIEARYGTQAAFVEAAGAGWNPSKLSRLLNGIANWSLEDFITTCRLLDVSADYMIGLMPPQAYESVQAPADDELVRLPVVEDARALSSDALILRHAVYWPMPKRMVRMFLPEPAPTEWDLLRYVCVISGGDVYLVDRRHRPAEFSGEMVFAGEDSGPGRAYSLNEVLTVRVTRGLASVLASGPVRSPRPCTGRPHRGTWTRQTRSGSPRKELDSRPFRRRSA